MLFSHSPSPIPFVLRFLLVPFLPYKALLPSGHRVHYPLFSTSSSLQIYSSLNFYVYGKVLMTQVFKVPLLSLLSLKRY